MLFGEGREGKSNGVKVPQIQFVSMGTPTDFDLIKFSFHEGRIEHEAQIFRHGIPMFESDKSNTDKQTEFRSGFDENGFAEGPYTSKQYISTSRITSLV